MTVAMTSDFQVEHIKYGTSPVLLVEIQSAGEFFATREPGFTGNWKAGDGLIAGSGIVAGAAYPTYQTLLTQIQNGGIGDISQSWEPQSGLALTGNTSVSIMNQGLFSHITDNYDLTNDRIRIRLGFYGQTFADYITVFQGAVEEFDATLLNFVLSCVDDTLVSLKPAPPQTGSDFLPRSLTVGRAIPIVLGDVDFIPVIPILGDVSGSLFLSMNNTDTEFYLVPVSAPFPPTGEVTIDSEVMTYASVREDVVAQQQVLIFSGLDRPSGVSHNAGAVVNLTSVTYEYLLCMEAASVRRIRLESGADPTTAVTVVSRPLEPGGNDPRRITVLQSATADELLNATVEGENRAPNLIENGEGEGDPTTYGWSATAGSWAAVALGKENVIRGRVNASQSVDSELVQDVTTTDGALMRLTGTITLDATNTPPFATIRIGTPSSPTSVFDFGQIVNTFDTGVDLTFRAPTGGTTRITLVVNSDTPGTAEDAYFDHLHLYEVDSENPATQVEFLINKHLANIEVDRASFDEATSLYRETGDRLAGVLDTTQEAQGLLGRLAFQFRAKTFFNEQGHQKWVLFDNARPEVLEITTDDVNKGTFHVSLESEEKIHTNYYVYFNRRADVSDGTLGGRESYQNVMYATPEGTNSVEDAVLSVLCQQARDAHRVNRTMEIFADCIPDASTADRLLSHIVRENTYRRYIATFTTWINNIELEVADIVRIGHPLLPDSANGVTYEVQDKQFHPNGMLVSYKCAEIRQSQYSAWVERWEPKRNGTVSLIHEETFNEPPLPLVAFQQEDGTIIRCNPWLESWEPIISPRHERFQYNDAFDEVGIDNVVITESLILSHDSYFTTYTNPVDDPGQELLYPVSNHLPQTTEFPGFATVTDVFEVFSSYESTITANLDYQRDTINGIPAPSTGSRRPVTLPTGGPGSNPAMQFLANGTLPTLTARRQSFRMSSLPSWNALDFTVNFWMYQSEKGSNARPFLNSRIPSETDDTYQMIFWWDPTADRYVYTLDYNDANGLNDHPTLANLITELKASTNYTVHTGLAPPALNTWYMHTVRWDLSALTLTYTINASTSVNTVLGAAPTVSSTSIQDQLYWMSLDRFSSKDPTTHPTAYGMNGRFAQPSTWSRRITDSEVTSLYNAGASLPYPFL